MPCRSSRLETLLRPLPHSYSASAPSARSSGCAPHPVHRRGEACARGHSFSREIEIVGDATAAVRLDGIIEDTQGDPWGAATLIMAISSRPDLVAGLVHHVGGFQAQATASSRYRCARGRYALPKPIARRSACRRRLREASRRLAIASMRGISATPMRAHAMMDAPRPEPALRDFEPPALAEDQVFSRHAHVLQDHLGNGRAARRRNRKRAAWRTIVDARRVERHEDLGLLLVRLGRRVGLAHDDRDLAARIADARRPPFATVDHIIDRHRDGSTSRYWWRRRRPHQRSVIRKAERISPAISGFSQRSFCAGAAIAVQHLHVAGIGRRTIEDLRGPADPAHRFGAERVIEVGESGTVDRRPYRARASAGGRGSKAPRPSLWLSASSMILRVLPADQPRTPAICAS